MWVKSNGFLPVLVLLFFLSSAFCWGEEAADITKAELRILLEERQTIKNELATLKAESVTREQRLTELKAENETIKLELARLRLESQIRIDLLTTLKKETTWNNVKWFFSGLLGGYSLNELKGDLLR